MKAGGFLNSVLRSRLGRVALLVTVFLLLATVIPAGPSRSPTGPAVAVVTAVAVDLDNNRPERRRVGELVFLRGWALTSDEPRFGAVSAMHIEGNRVTAISDAGDLLFFGLPRRPGTLSMEVRPLSYGAGTAKRNRDTESLWVGDGVAWVGFESVNAIKRFRLDDWREESAARPAAMRRWRSNGGAEAMVRLADGRFLVLAEGRDNDQPFSPALVFEGDPADSRTRAMAVRYRRPVGFRVTDAALLPDGRLLILHRRVRLLGGISAILTVADVPALREGAIISGREIAALREPLTVDNMEALSVAREGGRTIVRIASDDNFLPIQQTLLLEFAWIERAARD